MEYEIQSTTRHCAATGREFAEGEVFYSVLSRDGGRLTRSDFCKEAWAGAPEDALGWWKSRMPVRAGKKNKLAPGEVLLGLFEQLASRPDQDDMRYVLALLLVRRRLLRLEEPATGEAGQEIMMLYNPQDGTTHQVRSVDISSERASAIQAELGRLLEAETG